MDFWVAAIVATAATWSWYSWFRWRREVKALLKRILAELRGNAGGDPSAESPPGPPDSTGQGGGVPDQ